MKASKNRILKVAQLGILRSMPDFLEEPLKPGRLKRKFTDIALEVDLQLARIKSQNNYFFVDNKKEIEQTLSKFGAVAGWSCPKEEIHIASVASFCLAMLEDVEEKYAKRIISNLSDIVEYYERVGNIKYSDLWNGTKFKHIWNNLNEIHPK